MRGRASPLWDVGKLAPGPIAGTMRRCDWAGRQGPVLSRIDNRNTPRDATMRMSMSYFGTKEKRDRHSISLPTPASMSFTFLNNDCVCCCSVHCRVMQTSGAAASAEGGGCGMASRGWLAHHLSNLGVENGIIGEI